MRRGRDDKLLQAADAIEAKSPGAGRDQKLSMVKVAHNGMQGWAYLSVIDWVRDYIYQNGTTIFQRGTTLSYDAIRRAYERDQARKKNQ